MHALVTAPIPSHPQNHGNRARVYGVCREMQARGYKIHYVYSGFEGLSDEQEDAMRACWDHVYIISREHVVRNQSRRTHNLIDDWHSPELTRVTERILKIWDIKLCVANYVWQSAWLDHVPRDIPRYIDTHDVFGDRHKALIRDGIEPSWFSTTPKEEAKALMRTTAVIAIQDQEAEVFRTRSPRPVYTLGFFDPPRFVPARPGRARGEPLKVGYIASDNPINVNALAALRAVIEKKTDLLKTCKFYLAGPICNTDAAQGDMFTRLGFVPSVDGFYADMDVILNPNIGGSGLKIKSVEALSYGVPILATRDAMIGIGSSYPLHSCPDVPAMGDALQVLAGDDTALDALRTAGRDAYTEYRALQLETLDQLFPRVEEGA